MQPLSPVPGLMPGQFRLIGAGGFGDGENSYAHAMGWFNGRLFVGTTRRTLVFQYYRKDAVKAWTPFPVRKCDGYPYASPLGAGQFWRYDPPTQQWDLVHSAAMMPPDKDGVQVPRFIGCRNMVVHQRPGEDAPALYIMTISPRGGPGPMLYRTFDGSAFEPIEFRGADAKAFTSFRPLVLFKGRWFTAATGRVGNASSAGAAIVMSCRDPLTDDWQQVNPTNFGDPHNETVFEMTVFDNHLYAGTVHQQGFQLWKTDAEGDPPYRWTCVIRNGADRGAYNQAIGCLFPFNGALYVGASIIDGGYDERYNLGPASGEILRVHPDDSWDLLIGDARIDRTGRLRVPLSGYGPGFDKVFNTYFWRMCVHEGWLYITTMSTTGLLPYLPRGKWPEHVKRMLDEQRTQFLMEKLGGFDLWRTRDGLTWVNVTRNGFANPFNYGGRTLCSTPLGLFLGTANPFGPEIATRRPGGWAYEPNPRGGCEVFLGSRQAQELPFHPSVGRPVLDLLPSLPRPPAQTVEAPHDDPVGRLLAEFFEGSGFRTFGRWEEGVRSPREAARHLLDDLLLMAPPGDGRILDLGGSGGSTLERLAQRGWGGRIAAACFAPADVARLFDRVEGLELFAPGRGRWNLPEKAFTSLLDLQALSGQEDAVDRLRELPAALAAGGALAGLAVLGGAKRSPWRIKTGLRSRPVTTAEAFADLLRASGFGQVEVEDVTRSTWIPFQQRLSLFLLEKTLAHEVDDAVAADVKARLYGLVDPVAVCIRYRAAVAPTPGS